MKQDHQKILKPDGGQLRSNSAPSPRAHYPELCTPRTIEDRNINNYLSEIALITRHCDPIDCIFELQFFSGCRISEALSVTARDVDAYGRVIIRGKKKSGSRIVQVVYTKDWIVQQATKVYMMFQDVNRFAVYRRYKAKGITMVTPEGRNNRVTHALRTYYIRMLRGQTDSPELTAELIRHKNINSQEYYMK